MDQLRSEFHEAFLQLSRKFNQQLRNQSDQIERQQGELNHQCDIIKELSWQIRDLRDSVRKCNDQISWQQSKNCIDCAKNRMTLNIPTTNVTKRWEHVAEFIASESTVPYKTIMIKQVMIAIVLTSLLVGNSWDAEARERATVVRQEKIVDFAAHSEPKVREKRFINPFTSLFNVWNAITHIYSLYAEQKNETYFALEQTYDIVADGFNDTYMATKRPTTTTTGSPDSEPTTTTQRYRITRKEFGYILGRNLRGLKKLYNIEINDALNQSKYNIDEYKREKAWALYPYTIKKFPPPKNNTSN
ncbi:uncharacterized protein LOC129565741 isoform X1 [Sitodiplosis mosellana]|uniref:uncharacterized protein LOC129565741 isoform X1 n=1 Tax=Sitodiplosis mosellana TaxID=263140 RepID=UPI0024451F62|nr:uncharacterized protein LOC129565741 isoform X1 [Sitodiplosis mosellana]